MYEALAEAAPAQVVLATHSPVFLGIVAPDQMILFSNDGVRTTLTPGDRHPMLKNWRKDVDIPTLFAAGLL